MFATQRIAAGVTIDISPVLILPAHDADGTALAHYTYTWPAEDDCGVYQRPTTPPRLDHGERNGRSVPRQALALGLGSMFNHKRSPNVAWQRNIQTQSIRYFAIRNIVEGEELCISYGPKLWFDDADGTATQEHAVEDVRDVLSCSVDIFD